MNCLLCNKNFDDHTDSELERCFKIAHIPKEDS